ncbi:Fc.00g009770.m01.CDS01 [Cosmosporella sp. VM-42]
MPLLSPTAPPYRYPQLGGFRSFRLVKLLPPIRGLFSDTLRIEIITVDPENAGPYNTLSYAWSVSGRDPPDRRVIVETGHGRRELHTFRPLELALLNIKTDRPIFVDQICINQTDYDEKATQVQLMHDIYAKCTSVLVWLGPQTKLSNAYFDFTREVCQEGVLSRFYVSPGKNHLPEVFDAVMDPHVQVTGVKLEDRNDLLELLRKYSDRFPIDGMTDVMSRPWFNRLWIIQEACLAPTVTFVCGSRTLCFDCFRSGALCFSIYNTYWVGQANETVSQAELGKRSNIFHLNQSLIRLLQERKAIHERGERQTFYNLILKYNVNDETPKIGATLPDDRLYAIMGLAEPQSLAGVEVHYGDTELVYTEVAALLAVENLDTLLFSQFPKKLANLPSWVPDWSMDLKTPHGYEKLTEPVFKAGGMIREQPRADIESKALIVQGVIVDKIVRVGHRGIYQDQERQVMEQVEYRAVKRFYDEIQEFLPQAHQTKEGAILRIPDFGLTLTHFEKKYHDGTDKMKSVQEQVSKLGQKLIDTDKGVRAYHISRIVGTIGILPWYWVPPSEIDELRLWATKPVAAFFKWTKVVGLFLTDLVGILYASARVVGTAKYLKFRRQRAGTTFPASDGDIGEDALRNVGIDPDVIRGKDMNTYTTNLFRNIGQRMYLTEQGYMGLGPGSMEQEDMVVVLYGGTVPHILRKSEIVDGWSYIGETYCDGIMDGEMLQRTGTTFRLV